MVAESEKRLLSPGWGGDCDDDDSSTCNKYRCDDDVDTPNCVKERFLCRAIVYAAGSLLLLLLFFGVGPTPSFSSFDREAENTPQYACRQPPREIIHSDMYHGTRNWRTKITCTLSTPIWVDEVSGRSLNLSTGLPATASTTTASTATASTDLLPTHLPKYAYMGKNGGSTEARGQALADNFRAGGMGAGLLVYVCDSPYEVKGWTHSLLLADALDRGCGFAAIFEEDARVAKLADAERANVATSIARLLEPAVSASWDVLSLGCFAYPLWPRCVPAPQIPLWSHPATDVRARACVCVCVTTAQLECIVPLDSRSLAATSLPGGRQGATS